MTDFLPLGGPSPKAGRPGEAEARALGVSPGTSPGPAGPPGASHPRLTLVTLGGWALASADAEGAPAPVFGPSKPLALLIYLACAPGRTARREHMVDLLWADLEPDAAHHAFRQTLWYIRQRIGADGVASDAGQVSLTADVEVDRDAFESVVAQQDHERAVALYTGDFLPGFAAPGGAEFEHWADLERGRLRRTFLRAASTLVQARLDASRFREAVVLARRARDTDPQAEAGWRLLLEALLSSGDRLGAALVADQLRQSLGADSREPEPATRAFLRQASEGAAPDAQIGPIRAARPTPEDDRSHGAAPAAAAGTTNGASAPAIVAELVGREREFAAILDAWNAARSGPARFVHVLGAAGLGKTRLLGDIHTRLRATGARCVLVRANPGERGVAFSCAADTAAALAGLTGAMGISGGAAATLVGLCPALSARFPSAYADHGAAEELVRHRILAIAELVAAVSEEGPLAILLDDAHWMDAASRQVLTGVSIRLSTERVLIVSTSRPTPEMDLSRPDLVLLPIEPLTPAQVGALVASMGVLPDEPWASDFAAQLHAAASGSPLLALETLQLVIERGVLSLSGDGWRCGDPSALASALSEGSAVERRVAALGRDRQWLLLLLAVAGAPVPRAELDPLLAKPAEAVDRDVNALEQRGFLTKYGEHLSPAHDSIAEAAIAGAPPDALRAANLAIGRALARHAVSDPDLASRAARHLAAAGDTADLGRVLAHAVRQARRGGDRRPLRLLVADVLGRANAGAVGGALRQLPISVRIGLTTPARVAAAVVVPVAAVGLALTILLRATATPEVALVVRTRIDAMHETIVAVPLSDALFDSSGPLDLRTMRQAKGIAPRFAPTTESGRLTPQPGGRWWAFTRISPDTGGLDLYAATAHGDSLRLSSARGDDGGPSWSPDGRLLVFMTDRWNPRGAGDLAVMDLASGRVSQLTSGDARDTDPAWSPDGTRIAFVRSNYGRDGRSWEVCWTTVDGRQTECAVIRGRSYLALAGWLDAERLLLANQDSALASRVEAFNLGTRQLSSVLGGQPAWIGAGGQFATGSCSGVSGSPSYPCVFPVAHPERARRLVAAGEIVDAPVTWTRADAVRPWIERLTIDLPPDSAIPLDGPYRLTLRGRDERGEAVSVPPGIVRWTSSDTVVATVDGDGTLRPRREGSVTVTASAGGWRTTSALLRVVPTRTKTLLTENWTRGIGPAWRAFGDPRPFTTTGPGGVPALAEHGDSSWASGVYSTAELSPADGFGVEALISSPIREDRWQTVQVHLSGGIDSADLASWDHATGFGPIGRPRILCTAMLPGGESVGLLDRLHLSAGGEQRSLPRGLANRSGRWWRLRIQVLPDGRCGVAVDGKPVWLSERRLRADLRYRVVLQGMSHHTRILFGPVEVWQGVRRKVDWEAVAGTAGGGGAKPRSPQ